MADIPISFDRLLVEPAYRVVANAVEQQIMEGRIKLGQRLPSETELARQLGVNRSTVREAIRVLEQNGLVGREGGRRLVATMPRQADLATRVSRAMILHEVTFLELWETMMALEVMAAQLAAERATEEDLARLDANLKATEAGAAVGDNKRLVELDIEFHLIVAQASKNRALLLAREPVGLLFYPSFFNVMSRLNAGERLFVAHGEILRGIREHDPKHAGLWMERHIKDFKRGYELANLDIGKSVDYYPVGT